VLPEIDKRRQGRVGFCKLVKEGHNMVGPIGLLGPIGTTELIIILVIVVLIFGVNKIPQLGKGLGEGIRNFKSSIKEISAEADKKPPEEEK